MIVRQFLEWMETAPAGRRAEAAHALARAYLYSTLDDETRSGMEAVMTLLLDDPAPEVRNALCDALGASRDAPRHIVIALSQDLPYIARSVLARSPVFIDAELVDMVAVADADMQAAIASRPAMSGEVSAALAEVGTREACRILIANPSASILPSALRRLAQRLGDDPEIRDALIDRGGLPADVHQLLVRRLADTLGELLVRKGWVEPGRAKRLTRESCDRATVALCRRAGRRDLTVLVRQLRSTGQLTTELLLRTVCCGRMGLFEAALTSLTGVAPDRVSAIVASARPAALRALYAKAGLPESAFDAFAAAAHVWRNAGSRNAGDRYATTMQAINAVMTMYTGRAHMTDMAAVLRRFAADQARDAARTYAMTPSRSKDAPRLPATVSGLAA